MDTGAMVVSPRDEGWQSSNYALHRPLLVKLGIDREVFKVIEFDVSLHIEKSKL